MEAGAAKRRVLIVDDEPASLELVRMALENEYDILEAKDGEQGLAVAESACPDLVILDLGLPLKDGSEICQTLRENPRTSHIPVIILTGQGELERKVELLRLGADDYICKPYHVTELQARVSSRLRRTLESPRSGSLSSAEQLSCGNLRMDLAGYKVYVAGARVQLSVLEFNLLRCFLENVERVLSRERILEIVWKGTAVSDRTIDTHVVSLRKNLQGFEYQIKTVYGAGYILQRK